MTLHLFSLRAAKWFQLAGGHGDWPSTQTLSLLQRDAPLSSAEADLLEEGLFWTLGHMETHVQLFLEKGGLATLLERTIRPGATQLLEKSVGSCSPIMLPPGKGVLIPRAVLLKAMLVEVGF